MKQKGRINISFHPTGEESTFSYLRHFFYPISNVLFKFQISKWNVGGLKDTSSSKIRPLFQKLLAISWIKLRFLSWHLISKCAINTMQIFSQKIITSYNDTPTKLISLIQKYTRLNIPHTKSIDFLLTTGKFD